MTRIAIIGNQAFSLFNFRGKLIERMVFDGHEVHALAPNMDTASAEKLRALGAVPHEIFMSRTGANPLKDMAALGSIWAMLRKIRPDLTLGYSSKPVIYGGLAARLARVPYRFSMIEGLGYIFIARPNETLRSRLLRAVVSSLFRLSLSGAKRVFFLNKEDMAEFIDMNLVDGARCSNIGGIGVDLKEWRPVPPVFSPLTFTFIGRLLKDKGVLEYVEAAKLVKARYQDTRFIIVGGLDDNPASITPQEIDAWQKQGWVEWPGHVDVKPWLEQTSVFVLPSYREGVPRSTQEAMAMARPVITTDAVGCRDTVEDGANGYLVPVRNAEALAGAMVKFIENTSLVASMGAASRKIAEAKFDVDRINKLLINEMNI